MASRSKTGRRRRSRNRGYWFRADRGYWVVTTPTGPRPLLNAAGNRIKNRDSEEEARASYGEWLTRQKQAQHEAGANGSDMRLEELADRYLAHVKASQDPETFLLYLRYLWDFTTGLPFRCCPARPTRPRNGQANGQAKRIHPGYGKVPFSKLTKYDVTEWLNAHVTWRSTRNPLKVLKTMFNWAVDCGLIAASPILGVKHPKAKENPRIIYITPEQEAVVGKALAAAQRDAFYILIRTGMRPVCEFAALEKRHVTDCGDHLELIFPPGEGKKSGRGKRERRILVTDPRVMELSRRYLQEFDGPRVFRNSYGEPWKASALRRMFAKVRQKVGSGASENAFPYATRHTYAKRCLMGYWTGEPCDLATLAVLMGDELRTVVKYYAQWEPAHQARLLKYA
jgi:integrase